MVHLQLQYDDGNLVRFPDHLVQGELFFCELVNLTRTQSENLDEIEKRFVDHFREITIYK